MQIEQYKQGMVKVVQNCTDNDCDNWDDDHRATGHLFVQQPNGTIFLPHSCDEWLIG